MQPRWKDVPNQAGDKTLVLMVQSRAIGGCCPELWFLKEWFGDVETRS